MFFQLLKLKKEITNVSISFNDGKQDLELPSITFCPHAQSWRFTQKVENRTFEEYMEQVLNVSDFFYSAYQEVYLSGIR